MKPKFRLEIVRSYKKGEVDKIFNEWFCRPVNKEAKELRQELWIRNKKHAYTEFII